MRVALLTNLVPPYRLPVYRELSETPGWSVRYFVNARREARWATAFEGSHEQAKTELEIELVPSLAWVRRVRAHPGLPSEEESTLYLPWGAWGALSRFRPEVVVSGELGPRTVIAALYCAWHRIPLVIWSYRARDASNATPGWRRWIRRTVLSWAAAVVGMGAQAHDVLRIAGVPEWRLFDAPNAHVPVDVGDIETTATRAAWQAQLGLRERVAIVAGRLEPMKGVQTLIDAWQRLPDAQRQRWSLLFVGDGSLSREVSRAQRALPRGSIARLPAQPSAQLAALFRAADLSIFPSLADPWGLVVNEAMAAGTPVLCSRLAGCSEDLIRHDQNGWLFDPTDSADVDACLRSALDCEAIEERGAAARTHVSSFTAERQAAGLRRAVVFATRR